MPNLHSRPWHWPPLVRTAYNQTARYQVGLGEGVAWGTPAYPYRERNRLPNDEDWANTNEARTRRIKSG